MVRRREPRDGLCLFRAMCHMEGQEGSDEDAGRNSLEVVGWVRDAWEAGNHELEAATD